MNAGRELDALVAEMVMGWVPLQMPTLREPMLMPPERVAEMLPEFVASHRVKGEAVIPIRVPRYSTDIAAAWAVVERISRNGGFAYLMSVQSVPSWKYGADFNRDDGATGYASEDSMPLAICLAALEVVGAEVPA